MILLSIDQSSHVSGYAIFKDSELLTYGKFSADAQDIGKRLCYIRDQIKELINKYNVNYVVFEDIQQQNNVVNNVQTFKILAEVYGVVSQLLTELNIPYNTILSVKWKSSLDIKGKTRAEQKKNAQEYVIKKYNKKPTQDECDAICIGEHYLKSMQCAWSD